LLDETVDERREEFSDLSDSLEEIPQGGSWLETLLEASSDGAGFRRFRGDSANFTDVLVL